MSFKSVRKFTNYDPLQIFFTLSDLEWPRGKFQKLQAKNAVLMYHMSSFREVSKNQTCNKLRNVNMRDNLEVKSFLNL